MRSETAVFLLRFQEFFEHRVADTLTRSNRLQGETPPGTQTVTEVRPETADNDPATRRFSVFLRRDKVSR